MATVEKSKEYPLGYDQEAFGVRSTIGLSSLMAQTEKHLPTVRETRVWSLGWEAPLEKEMATHSSTLAWKIPWMEEPGGLQSVGSQRVRHDWATSLSVFTFMHWRRKRQPSVLAWRIPGTGEPRPNFPRFTAVSKDNSSNLWLRFLGWSLKC